MTFWEFIKLVIVFVLGSIVTCAGIFICSAPALGAMVYIQYRRPENPDKNMKSGKIFLLAWCVGAAALYAIVMAIKHKLTWTGFFTNGVIYSLLSLLAAIIAIITLLAIVGFIIERINRWASEHFEVKKPLEKPDNGGAIALMFAIILASGLFLIFSLNLGIDAFIG